MKVKAVAIVSNEDVTCEPGDVFDLKDAIAEVYIKNGWVKRYKLPHPKDEIESTSLAGAPERAVSRRGRRGRIPIDER